MDFTLQLRNAMINRNDVKFFKLYQSSPHLSGYLIDYMLNSMRTRIFDSAIKSYDNVPISFMMEKLNFTDIKECKEFLDSCRVRYVSDAKVPESSSTSVVTSSSLKSKRKDKKKDKKMSPKKPPVVVQVPLETLCIDCRASRTL